LFPLLRALFTLLLRLQPKAIEDSLAHTNAIVDRVDRRLSDGRRFLNGDAATLSDLSFATAIAPFTLPVGYTAPAPPYERMPVELKQIIDAFRRRPSAALVQRTYDLRGLVATHGC
jgi:glutathione S-transferase